MHLWIQYSELSCMWRITLSINFWWYYINLTAWDSGSNNWMWSIYWGYWSRVVIFSESMYMIWNIALDSVSIYDNDLVCLEINNVVLLDAYVPWTSTGTSFSLCFFLSFSNDLIALPCTLVHLEEYNFSQNLGFVYVINGKEMRASIIRKLEMMLDYRVNNTTYFDPFLSSDRLLWQVTQMWKMTFETTIWPILSARYDPNLLK